MKNLLGHFFRSGLFKREEEYVGHFFWSGILKEVEADTRRERRGYEECIWTSFWFGLF